MKRTGIARVRSSGFKHASVALAAAMLTACGGSGSSGRVDSTPAPPAPPLPSSPVPATPAEPPATTGEFVQVPVPAQYNTREFRDSDGPKQHNAHAAWSLGYTGQGVTIGIVDTGIDDDSPEFAGRISPASTDIEGTRPLTGPDDHGTIVATVAAGARDSTGVLGIAWESTILAVRSDAPGTCGTDNPTDATSECSFSDRSIAESIDHAVANGAKVINISLGGPEAITTRLQTAVANAADAGVLIVVAAGNEGLDELERFASTMATAGAGGVLIVGSVDENYVISDFSNRPGSEQTYFLAARGERICCSYEDGELFVDGEGYVYLNSGTSFSAPQVAGAAALLAQAYPHLTGQQIGDILLRSAFDAGDSGSDAVYGRGILDIAKAFTPIGTTSVAGEATPLAVGDPIATASPAMGDALGTASLTTLITDEYKRAFAVNLASGLRDAPQTQRLHGALTGQQRSVGAANGPMTVAFSIDASRRSAPQAEALRLNQEQAEQARVLAARVSMALSPETAFSFAYAQGADGLVAGLQGVEGHAFAIATTGTADAGFQMRSDASFALRHSLGDWGLTASASSGRIDVPLAEQRALLLRGEQVSDPVATFGIAIDRSFGDIDAALGFNLMSEARSLLGATFHEGLGLSGSETMFVDIDLGWNIAAGWRAGASWRQGFSTPHGGALLGENSDLASSAWSFDLARSGVFADNDALALRVAQPLRVESGSLNLLLPSDFSYTTLTPTYSERSIALSPSGREVMGEVSWRGSWGGGAASTSVFVRRQPGHIADAPMDAGIALRYGRKF